MTALVYRPLLDALSTLRLPLRGSSAYMLVLRRRALNEKRHVSVSRMFKCNRSLVPLRAHLSIDVKRVQQEVSTSIRSELWYQTTYRKSRVPAANIPLLGKTNGRPDYAFRFALVPDQRHRSVQLFDKPACPVVLKTPDVLPFSYSLCTLRL